MKVSPGLKAVLLGSTTVLFLSGVAYYVLDHFFKMKSEFGDAPRYAQIFILHFHAIVSFWFLGLFGYFYAKHIEPSRRGQLRRKSGYSLLIAMIVLFATVPGLYYVADEQLKSAFVFTHTYLGLILPLPFVVHLFKRARHFARTARAQSPTIVGLN